MEEKLTTLETDSAALLETADAVGSELQEFYTRLAAGESVEQEEFTRRIDGVKRSSSATWETYKRLLNISDELTARWNDYKRSRKKRLIPRTPTNAAIDLEEKHTRHFAQGLSIYKVLWICYIGSFAGVVVELLWCLLTRGYLESRSGLVYGPFNLLYGAGAMALTLALYRYRNHGKWQSFLGGFVVGSVVEYLCSWGQEILLGSRSWDYSAMPFNLNGRICLLYSMYWGVLGVLWIKTLYPWTAKLILKIPNRLGKVITWVIFAFFVFNAVVSLIAVFRWSQRLDGIEAMNSFWAFIDARFPNERMERIYANMVFG